MRRRPAGVVLLFVLALLALFALLMVTFVIVARQAKRSQMMAAHIERRQSDPQELLHAALLQILRGDNNAQSALRSHSLLEDLYGSDGVQGVVEKCDQFVANGALMYLEANGNGLDGGTADDFYGYYNGRVITMLSGPCAGQSSRVTNYEVTKKVDGTFTTKIQLAPFPSMQPDGARGWTAASRPRKGDGFLINGRPFNGSGFGFDANWAPLREGAWNSDKTKFTNFDWNEPTKTFLLGAKRGNGHEFALLPNPARFEAFGAYVSPEGPGGADEDYDAPDYQNMLLAMRIWNASKNALETPLPSLHRPDLLRYWMKRQGASKWDDLPPELLGRVMLRPNAKDHKGFSPTNFDAINGPWDIDNDGDGEADSVWVDLGLPVQTAPGGRLYKPLFAIMCVDLDSKLNLNAHGNTSHLASAPLRVGGPFAPSATATEDTFVAGAGVGVGPATINLNALFRDRQLFFKTRYGEAGRSDFSGIPQAGATLDKETAAAFRDFSAVSETQLAVARRAEPLWAQMRRIELPLAFSRSLAGQAYATPPDLLGNGYVALDWAGQPLFFSGRLRTGEEANATLLAPERFNSPYNVDLSRGWQAEAYSNGIDWRDTPLTPAELEWLLRDGSIDSPALTERVKPLRDALVERRHRHLLTTESWDVPAPAILPTLDMISADKRGGYGIVKPGHTHIADLLRLKLEDEFNRRGDRTTAKANPDQAIRSLLAPELLAGLRLNINRILGNGRNDAADPPNEVVDEPQEAHDPATGRHEMIWQDLASANNPIPSGVPLDHNNDGRLDARDQYARQRLAKHIYVLLMLFADHDFKVDIIQGARGWNEARETAREFAQWAVNVVDFRDADSIMTPFEYDIYPFTDENNDGDPWDVDGYVGVAPAVNSDGSFARYQQSADDGEPFRGRVYGLERPELLLTETLALHDRRMEDTNRETHSSTAVDSADVPANQKSTTDASQPQGQTKDEDWDQRLRPVGSLFVELYNPWDHETPAGVTDGDGDGLPDGVRPKPPAEFYEGGGLALSKKSGAVGRAPAPVWRLSMIKEAEQKRASRETPLIEPKSHLRDAYFVPPPSYLQEDVGAYNHTGAKDPGRLEAERFWPATAPPSLRAKQYAIVGPSGDPYFSRGIPAGPILADYNPKGGSLPPPDARFELRLILDNGDEKDFAISDRDSDDRGPDDGPGKDAYPRFEQHVKRPLIVDLNRGDEARVRFSVSEPKGGYQRSNSLIGGDQPGILQNVYDVSADKLNSSLEIPRLSTDDKRYDYNRTSFDKTAIVLERLANPLLPWNPEHKLTDSGDEFDRSLPSNPYVWVDWLDTTVAVFNSLDRQRNEPNVALPGGLEDNEQDGVMLSAKLAFDTVSRVDLSRKDRNLWAGTWNYPDDAASQEVNKDGKPFGRSTLGFLNYSFKQGLSNYYFFGRSESGDGPLGDPLIGDTEESKGTIPWFTWNNRPYHNTGELLLTSGESACDALLFHTTGIRAGNKDPYVPDLKYDGNYVRQYFPAREAVPFGHLKDFFLSSGDALVTTTIPPPIKNPWDPNRRKEGTPNARFVNNPPPPYARVLEYLGVPSPFGGTQQMLDPKAFQAAAAGQPLRSELYPFYAPFNFLSTYREPGRVNLNGVFDSAIWDAIAGNVAGGQFQSTGDFWRRFWQNRRGYGGYQVGDDFKSMAVEATGDTPSIFSAPFRSNVGGYYVPAANLRSIDVTSQSPGPNLRRFEVDGGLLRESLGRNAAPPAFPLFGVTNGPAHRDATRNPFFFYEMISRLSSLATTRSNVYAVWVTVGYFEVEPAPSSEYSYTPAEYKLAFPQGQRLGRELGADTGDIKRHRAFYLIDRSLPVGFERGRNHNVWKTVLLHRFIE